MLLRQATLAALSLKVVNYLTGQYPLRVLGCWVAEVVFRSAYYLKNMTLL
jgi:hypothetical protein